jgi:hypothetical protein
MYVCMLITIEEKQNIRAIQSQTSKLTPKAKGVPSIKGILWTKLNKQKAHHDR